MIFMLLCFLQSVGTLIKWIFGWCFKRDMYLVPHEFPAATRRLIEGETLKLSRSLQGRLEWNVMKPFLRRPDETLPVENVIQEIQKLLLLVGFTFMLGQQSGNGLVTVFHFRLTLIHCACKSIHMMAISSQPHPFQGVLVVRILPKDDPQILHFRWVTFIYHLFFPERLGEGRFLGAVSLSSLTWLAWFKLLNLNLLDLTCLTWTCLTKTFLTWLSWLDLGKLLTWSA